MENCCPKDSFGAITIIICFLTIWYVCMYVFDSESQIFCISRQNFFVIKETILVRLRLNNLS